MQAIAVLVVTAVGATASMPSTPGTWTAYASGRTELRSVSLPDGTLVQMDRDSVLVVRFDADQRTLGVLRGGALFDVGHDTTRPLRVLLGANVLEDMGAVFDAHQSDDGSNVTVVSGRVKIWQQERDTWAFASGAPDGEIAADLLSGQQANMRRDGSLDLIDDHADLGLSTAWLPNDIHFERSTVADVARRFNAYSSQPLHIDDASIATMRISGRFHARDTEAFLAYLGSLPDVHVARGQDDIRVTSVSRGSRDHARL
ncbi:MAG: FecR domain-containing protein [Dyella sp.]|nr:FecR domain-containing protein [Dyella sp.]